MRQNQIGCKVTFRNAFGRSQVHNGKTTVWMCLDISSCVKSLHSDPSPPPPLQQKGMDHSFFKVSLSSLSHHTILWGRKPRSGTSRQYRLFIHPFPPLFLSSSSFLALPPHVFPGHCCSSMTQELGNFFSFLFLLTLYLN